MENQQGAHRNSKSGVRGVYWDKRHNKWAAELNHNGKKIRVGYFAGTPDIVPAEAEAAIIAKRNQLFTHNDIDRAGG